MSFLLDSGLRRNDTIKRNWIPAFAGMTKETGFRPSPEWRPRFSPSIPVFAGMTQ